MVAANAQGIAVTRDDPDLQFRPRNLQPRGEGRRATVNGMEAVGVHVIGETAGAADPRDDSHVLTRNALLLTDLRHGLLHLGEDRIISATGTPTDNLIGSEDLAIVLLNLFKFFR